LEHFSYGAFDFEPMEFPVDPNWMLFPDVYQSATTFTQHDQPLLPVFDGAPIVPDSHPTVALAAQTAASPTVDEDRIRCPEGCLATFSRPSDYRRHMNKHRTPRFKCPFFDCESKFYRADKLRDHLKQGHKGAKNPMN
jgi:uncharacterized Zn-finger protein